MNKVFVLVEPNKLSKGYFRMRNWQSKLPIFTKHVALSMYRMSEKLLIDDRKIILKEILENIKLSSGCKTDIDAALANPPTNLVDLKKLIKHTSHTIGFYNYHHPRFPELYKEFMDHVDEQLKHTTTQLEFLNKELKYISELSIIEVDYDIRFRKINPHATSWYDSDNYPRSCTKCGGEIPHTMYFIIGNQQICVFCMAALAEETKEQLSKCNPKTKEMWEKSVFINKLG